MCTILRLLSLRYWFEPCVIFDFRTLAGTQQTSAAAGLQFLRGLGPFKLPQGGPLEANPTLNPQMGKCKIEQPRIGPESALATSLGPGTQPHQGPGAPCVEACCC